MTGCSRTVSRKPRTAAASSDVQIVLVVDAGERRHHVLEPALLFAREQRLQEQPEPRIRVVDDRLGELGLARDRLHRRRPVAMPRDQPQGSVEHLLAAYLDRHPWLSALGRRCC